MSDPVQAVLFIAGTAFVDATVGGALSAQLQRGGWDDRAQKIMRGYQIGLFVAAAAAALAFLEPRALVLAVVLWVTYVEDVLYYGFLPAPIIRVLHFAVVGDTQRVQTGEPDPLWADAGNRPIPFGYLPPRLSGWLVHLPGKLRVRPTRVWACRLAIGGSVTVFLV